MVLSWFWGMAGYPLPTAELEFRRLERTNLMEPGENLRMFTFNANQYVTALTSEKLHIWREGAVQIDAYSLKEGSILIPLENYFKYPERIGILAAGAPEEAATARLTLHTSAWVRWDGENPHLELPGEVLSPEQAAEVGYEHMEWDYEAAGAPQGPERFLFQVESVDGTDAANIPEMPAIPERQVLDWVVREFNYTCARLDRKAEVEFLAEAVFYDQEGREVARARLSPLESPFEQQAYYDMDMEFVPVAD